MQEYIDFFAALSTSMSMWGSEKSSSKLTLFKSLKSTHTRILLHFLGATAMFNTCHNPIFDHFILIIFYLLKRIKKMMIKKNNNDEKKTNKMK